MIGWADRGRTRDMGALKELASEAQVSHHAPGPQSAAGMHSLDEFSLVLES